MADPFLDGKTMKLSKSGSDGICFCFLFLFVCFLISCRRLICFGGSPNRRPLQ